MCVFVAMMAVFALFAVPASALTAGQRAERKMTRAINAVRAQHGLPAFRRSGSLTGSAERYSSYLMQHDVFTHQSSIWAEQPLRPAGRGARVAQRTPLQRG